MLTSQIHPPSLCYLRIPYCIIDELSQQCPVLNTVSANRNVCSESIVVDSQKFQRQCPLPQNGLCEKSVKRSNIRFCTVRHLYIVVKVMTHITEICFAEGKTLLKPAGCSMSFLQTCCSTIFMLYSLFRFHSLGMQQIAELLELLAHKSSKQVNPPKCLCIPLMLHC